MNAKPSPTDPTLAQVEVARDPELMREIFQRHLRPLGKETYQVRECRISRAHYLKATRRILRYTLRLEETATGRERIELLTGVMYAEGGRARREWQELQRPEPGRTIPYALLTFEPFFFIPELEMLVQVFPYDHQLPGLPILMAGPPPTLEPLVLTRFGEGDWRTEAWDVEPVRYRTGTRMTLRLRVRVRNRTTGQLEERCFYAKVYREEEDGERTYEVARKLWERTEAGGEGFSVGRPVAYLSDLRSLVQEIVGAVVARSEAEAPTAPTHGDLHLRHILLHGGRPALIDLDAFAEGDPLLDIALILSDLAAMPLDSLLPRARARKASQAFVEEYFAHVPEFWRDGFPTCYARAVLKRAAKISRRQSQMPGRPDKVEALIKEAKSSLAGQNLG